MMRLFILALGFMLIGVWLNIVFNNYFQLGGLKINWMLIFMLVLTFRHPSLLVVPFVGVLAGLICDALSHGIMGLYGISFFVTLLLARQVIKSFYANTFFSVGIAVLGMSFFEGWISLSILGQFEESLNQFSLIMTSTLPLAVLQGLVTPIILQSVIWGEKLYLRDAA
tara:strand:+ start:19 stop:522 length:504 start_codon:yes stop_codon:yes gene_type:complete